MVIVGFMIHPGARGPLRKLGQKPKVGSQIEPHRLFQSFNGLLFTILIHFRSNKARRKQFGGPSLVLVSNFLIFLVWNPIALASGYDEILLCTLFSIVGSYRAGGPGLRAVWCTRPWIRGCGTHYWFGTGRPWPGRRGGRGKCHCRCSLQSG